MLLKLKKIMKIIFVGNDSIRSLSEILSMIRWFSVERILNTVFISSLQEITVMGASQHSITILYTRFSYIFQAIGIIRVLYVIPGPTLSIFSNVVFVIYLRAKIYLISFRFFFSRAVNYFLWIRINNNLLIRKL